MNVQEIHFCHYLPTHTHILPALCKWVSHMKHWFKSQNSLLNDGMFFFNALLKHFTLTFSWKIFHNSFHIAFLFSLLESIAHKNTVEMNIALAGQTYSRIALLRRVFQHEVSQAAMGLLPSSLHSHTPVRPVSTSKGLIHGNENVQASVYAAPPAVEPLRKNVHQ